MLYDELKEQLNNCKPDLEIINNYWKSSNIDVELKKLYEISNTESFWQNNEQTIILKKIQNLKQTKEKHDEIINNYNELTEIIDLFKDEEQELNKIFSEVKQLQKKISLFKITILLNDQQDNSSCFVNINSGAGGTESQDWANILLRMYLRFCEREKITADIIDYQPGETAGIKAVTLYIKGKYAYGLFKAEHGIHRLVRISPFDANKRRHTSFAGVFVTPEVPELEVNIDQKDLRIDTYRASGAGGQHVNKTDSAVRITHIPTNIVVQCQNERSQIQNREVAMKMLISKIAELQKEEQEKELNKIEKKKIEWGSQIRSYVLHPYKMVKDHRTQYESPQPELILDGEIMDFIEKFLLFSSQQQK
jgi:peptide chain release factor 2